MEPKAHPKAHPIFYDLSEKVLLRPGKRILAAERGIYSICQYKTKAAWSKTGCFKRFKLTAPKDHQNEAFKQPIQEMMMTKQEFSLAHLTVLECSPTEMIHIAEKTGYDFVSLRLITMGVPGEYNFQPYNQSMVKETKAALDQTGVRVLDIELARILPDNDPSDYIPAMEVGAELGARHLISSAWNIEPGDRSFITERYAQICELAKPYGLTVELEFPTFSALTTLSETVEVLQAADCDNCGILLDTLYFHFSKLTTEDLSTIPKEWFHFLHLCDTVEEVPETRDGKIAIARDNRLYIGEGCIDFTSIFQSLPSIPYSIELPNLKRIKEFGYEEHARQCINSAKEYLNNHTIGSTIPA